MKDYQVKIINSVAQWEAISTIWNKLLLGSNSNTIFLSWEWLSSWSECFINKNRRLFILAVYKKDELIGVAPWLINYIDFKVVTLKQIEFIGTPETGSDYLDVFAKKGKENKVAVCIYNFLLKEVPSLWDSLSLIDMPSDSLFLLHLHNKIQSEGKYDEITSGSFCPLILLPEKTEDFISQISTNRRQQYKRHLRILEKDARIEHHFSTGENIQTSLDNFFSIYTENRHHSKDSLHEFLTKFSSKCRDKNWIQIDFLTSNSKNIAGLLHLRYQNTLSMYQMAVDKTFNPKISIGNVLVGLCIEKAIGEGTGTYDFLKGSEHYKFHWSNNGKTSLNFFFCQKKITPIIIVIRKFLKYIIKIIIR